MAIRKRRNVKRKTRKRKTTRRRRNPPQITENTKWMTAALGGVVAWYLF